jgi:hypothetical protein
MVTYLIVLNLDPLLRLGHHITASPRGYLLKKMDPKHAQTDENHSKGKEVLTGTAKKWSERGKRFEAFPRPDESPKPSDWWLFLFAVRLLAISIYHAPKNLWVSLSKKSQNTSKLVEVRI